MGSRAQKYDGFRQRRSDGEVPLPKASEGAPLVLPYGRKK